MSTLHQTTLVEAGRAFAADFDPQVAPWNIVRFLVPRLADWALIGRVADNRTVVRVAHHVDGADTQKLYASDQITPAGQNAVHLDAIARVFRTSRPFTVDDVSQQPALVPTGLSVPGTRSLVRSHSAAPRRRRTLARAR